MSDEVKYKIRESEYDALVAERDALKAENIQLEKRIQGYHDTENAVIREVRAENEKLKEENERLRISLAGDADE